MTTKVVKKLKQITLFLMLFIGIMSCERDIQNVGVNLVENGIFDTQTYNSSVTAYNQNIVKRRANGLVNYLLGAYNDEEFGQIEASMATQLTPVGAIDFGIDPVIDTVILNIPYKTIDTSDAGLELEVIGDQDNGFNLKVYQLETYLNTLDPANPSEELNYYTDQDYSYGSNELYSGDFKPNVNDTVLYVKRPEFILDGNIVDIDTIKSVDAPSMRIPLNEDYFTNNFLLNPTPSIFESNDSFLSFFNGLYIESTKNGSLSQGQTSSLFSVFSSGSNVTIYYTNSISTEETILDSDGNVLSQTDLNNDDDFDDIVDVRTKQTATFNFNGITANVYQRDYTDSNADPIINYPDTNNGDEKLYLQGASGSVALIDLFTQDDIEELRNNEWLINEANLTFYVDQSTSTSIVPERLFVYNYDENKYLTDIFSEGFSAFDGTLELDDDDNPYKYTINITDYISNVLASDDPIDYSKLAVKVLNNSDTPVQGINTDTEIGDYSWTPKGIVLHGSQSSNLEKRLKLEITYTEVN